MRKGMALVAAASLIALSSAAVADPQNPWATPPPPTTNSPAPTPPAPTPPAPTPPAPTQPTPPAPTPPANAAKLDVVVLKNGQRIEGKIKEQVRGQYVAIQSSDGALRTISWDQVSEVIAWSDNGKAGPSPPPVTPPPVAPPAGPAAPVTAVVATVSTGHALKLNRNRNKKRVLRVATTTGGGVTKDGLGLSRTKICKSNDDVTCHETESVTIGSGGPKAQYVSENDCSKKPGTDKCKETKQAGVSAAGFGASYTKEEVVSVDEKKRPSGSVNVSITALAGAGLGTDAQIFVSNLDLNLKILGGGKFPGKKGGGWVGFAFEPTVGFEFQAISFADGLGGRTSITGTGARVGASSGLELIYFGKQNDKTLKQRGFGVFLGAFGGGQSITTQFMGMSMTQSDSSFGPEVRLLFPSYNAGTAKYSASSLNFLVLPTGKSVFVSIGFSKSF